MIIISRLGGALNRSGKEPPGPQTLLRGLKRFQDIALGTMLFGYGPIDLIVINHFTGHAQG
jgi:hypothetical protein